MATIQDMINGTNLVPGVIPKMRYRSNITNDVPRWIVSAIRNITDKYTFEELSVPGQPVTFQQNVFVYPLSDFTSTNVYVTRFDSFKCQISTNVSPTAITGQTSVFLELKWRSIKTISPLTSIKGRPMFYTIYGALAQVPGSGQVYIAFCPDNDYPCQAFYQRKHPFKDGLSDDILLPEAWLEVVACAAAEIGAQENAMTDILQLMRINLYGDPDNPREPGLIKALVSSRAQFSNVNERQLTFISGER